MKDNACCAASGLRQRNRSLQVTDNLINEIEFAERRLQTFCNLGHMGKVPTDAREFSRQIDAQFRQIRAAIGMPPFDPMWQERAQEKERD
jgi:hypothetical protein